MYYPSTIWTYGIIRGHVRQSDEIRMRQFYVPINSIDELTVNNVINHIQQKYIELVENGTWYEAQPYYTTKPLNRDERLAIESPMTIRKHNSIMNRIRNYRFTINELFSQSTLDEIHHNIENPFNPLAQQVASFNPVNNEFFSDQQTRSEFASEQSSRVNGV